MTDTSPNGAFDRLGRLVVRRHRWLLGLWAVLLLIAAPLAPRITTALRSGGFTLDDLPAAQEILRRPAR